MKRIIGIGSPFGADNLGWLAIDLLREERIPGWELLKLDRPGSELLRYFSGVEHLVLVDALFGGDVPGAPRRLEPSDLATSPTLTSSHGIGLQESLDLADRLGQLPPSLLLIGLETGADLGVDVKPDRRALLRLLREFPGWPSSS